MKKTLIILSAVLGMGVAKAQDFHLTQYENAPLYLNPALAGMDLPEDYHYRANLNYRSQWAKITSKPFSTAALSWDSKFKDKWGLGAHIVNNTSAQTQFKTMNIMLSGAYDVMNTTDDHTLSVGLQLGLMHKSFNSDGYTYDMQYDAGTNSFDETAYSGETIAGNSIFRFDANMGIFYRWLGHDMYKPYGGLSVAHMSFPNESFTSQKQTLPLRWAFHAGSDILINEEFGVRPTFLFMYQGGATEFNIGAMGDYKFENEDYQAYLGLNYRVKDAFIVQAGMRYTDFSLFLSYDINTSYLKNYTKGRGGFELGFIYRGTYQSEQLRSFFN